MNTDDNNNMNDKDLMALADAAIAASMLNDADSVVERELEESLIADEEEERNMMMMYANAVHYNISDSSSGGDNSTDHYNDLIFGTPSTAFDESAFDVDGSIDSREADGYMDYVYGQFQLLSYVSTCSYRMVTCHSSIAVSLRRRVYEGNPTYNALMGLLSKLDHLTRVGVLRMSGFRLNEIDSVMYLSTGTRNRVERMIESEVGYSGLLDLLRVDFSSGSNLVNVLYQRSLGNCNTIGYNSFWYGCYRMNLVRGYMRDHVLSCGPCGDRYCPYRYRIACSLGRKKVSILYALLNVCESFNEYCSDHSRVLELHPCYECMYEVISCMYTNREYGVPMCYHEHMHRLCSMTPSKKSFCSRAWCVRCQ